MHEVQVDVQNRLLSRLGMNDVAVPDFLEQGAGGTSHVLQTLAASRLTCGGQRPVPRPIHHDILRRVAAAWEDARSATRVRRAAKDLPAQPHTCDSPLDSVLDSHVARSIQKNALLPGSGGPEV